MRYLTFIFIFLAMFCPGEIMAQEIGNQILTGDASVESKHISHSKVDSTGGLQRSGGVYFTVPVVINGFPVSINKKGLDAYRGPDVLNSCAYYSASSTNSALCQSIINTATSAIQCPPGYIIAPDGTCQPDVAIDCREDQKRDSNGNCVCKVSGKVDDGTKCVTDCKGGQIDPQEDGTCECPTERPFWNNTDKICIEKECDSGCGDTDGTGCKTMCTTGYDSTDSCDKNKCCSAGKVYSSSANSGKGGCIADCTQGGWIVDPNNSNQCICPPTTVEDTSETPSVCDCHSTTELDSEGPPISCKCLPGRKNMKDGICSL